jgi:hypothetical protein
MIKSIVKWKLRLQYASTYGSIVGVPILVVNLLQEKLALIGVRISFVVLLFLTLVGIAIFGLMLDKLGVRESENDYNYSKQRKLSEDICARPIDAKNQ